jgi:hypothetical protein
LVGTRIVALPGSLDAARVDSEALLLRFAADEALVVGGSASVDDPASIIVRDTGWVAVRESRARLLELLEPLCAFELREGLNQGMVAGLPAKVLLAESGSMLIVAAPYAAELEERLRE